MTEFEKKMILTKDEYEYLLEFFDKLSPLNKNQSVKQINYYFDTDDLEMNRQNITCRVRLKDGRYKGTMKHHFFETDRSTEEKIEHFIDLDHNEFTNMGMRLFGHMETERRTIMEDSDYKVVLDKNKYLDDVDYELEIEYRFGNEIEAYAIFQSVVGEILRRRWLKEQREMYIQSKSTPSKSSRFFDRYTIINQKEQTKLSETENREKCCCTAYEPDNRDPDAYLKKYTIN